MPKHILIMEDDVPLRTFFHQVLTHNNCDVAATGSRMDALYYIHNHDFDYLLFDIEVEDGNALDVIRECCEQGQNVIVITANEQYLTQCREMGVLAFVRKPVTATELIQLINSHGNPNNIRH